MYTWGTYKDANGYIGYLPDVQKASEPTAVSNIGHVRIGAIASGVDHTLAVSADGYELYG